MKNNGSNGILQINLVSVMDKETQTRFPLLVLGEFASRKAFIAALKNVLSNPTDFDLRTLKIHDGGMWTTVGAATIIPLSYTYDDLIIEETE